MEIDSYIWRMATRAGFIELFWERLFDIRKYVPELRQEDLFEDMNEMYLATFGEPRFPSYDAFRKYRDRKANSD